MPSRANRSPIAAASSSLAAGRRFNWSRTSASSPGDSSPAGTIAVSPAAPAQARTAANRSAESVSGRQGSRSSTGARHSRSNSKADNWTASLRRDRASATATADAPGCDFNRRIAASRRPTERSARAATNCSSSAAVGSPAAISTSPAPGWAVSNPDLSQTTSSSAVRKPSCSTTTRPLGDSSRKAGIGPTPSWRPSSGASSTSISISVQRRSSAWTSVFSSSASSFRHQPHQLAPQRTRAGLPSASARLRPAASPLVQVRAAAGEPGLASVSGGGLSAACSIAAACSASGSAARTAGCNSSSPEPNPTTIHGPSDVTNFMANSPRRSPKWRDRIVRRPVGAGFVPNMPRRRTAGCSRGRDSAGTGRGPRTMS